MIPKDTIDDIITTSRVEEVVGDFVTLKKRGVNLLGGVSYEKIDDQGLHITVNKEPKVLDADSVVICAGQVSVRPFEDMWQEFGNKLHVIGGADYAGELDAVRAIRQGVELATKL